MIADREEQEERERLEMARNDVARRLRSGSSDLSRIEFQELVDKILSKHLRDPL
jgi:ribosome-binding protein aMBF1 (putative translation factor)